MEPKIRLKGFSGEWEESTIGKTAPLQRGFDLPTNCVVDGNVPVAYSNGILRYHITGKCDAPAVITGRSGTIGKFTYIPSGRYWPHNTSLWVTNFFGNNPLFVYYLFHTKHFENYSSGSGVPTLNRNDVHSLNIRIPKVEEQKAIASYFQHLDSLIQSTTKKIESLKQVKAASLQSMFPQEGETTPRVRFKGFAGEWEKVEFGSLITECFDKTTEEDEDVLLSSAIDGLYLNSELFTHFRGQSNKGYRKVKKNMLILSAQNLHLGNANVNLRFEHGIVSPAYKIYYIHDCNPELLSHWIKRDETKKFFLDATTSGASVCRKNIVWQDLYRQTLYLPKDAKEQEMLASYLTNLSSQITLQTQRLEKLKQIKSACLDNMFV